MSVGDTNHSLYGAYGPGNGFRAQANFHNFWWTNLNLTVSANDTGMVVNEGVTYNWLRRQYVFCGGQQVLNLFYGHKYSLVSKMFLSLRNQQNIYLQYNNQLRLQNVI
jgi:hypothetical protein